MAKTFVSPKNGAVALPTGFNCDFSGFEIDESQQVESIAAYGGSAYDPWRGSGTPHQSVSASGFATYGASGLTAGFSKMAASGGDSGGAATFTIDTGVTLAGSYVVSRLRLQHARLRAAVPLTFQLENSGDPTVTWPVA